jgi:DNA repair protein RAD16
MKAEDLKKFDVVMVSYGTLEASFRKQQKGFTKGDRIIKEKSPMHTFQWYRSVPCSPSGENLAHFLLYSVILDEAHNIKERSTNAAKAAFALDAKYRWCLSGTPLQNRVGELYSLVRFLGGDRMCNYVLLLACPFSH